MQLVRNELSIQGQSTKLGQRPLLAKKDTFFEKKKKNGTENLTTPYSIPFLNVLHQNKASHNFHKRGLHLIAGCIKGLD